MTEELKPKDHAEAVALFRAQVLGPLVCRDWLGRGELAGELRALSRETWRPPGAAVSRSYSVTTLERWYYLYRHGGLEALEPGRRSDRGYVQALSEEQKPLVLDVRRDHPRVSASLILRTLEADGRLPEGLLTEATLRRLYRAHGLDRRTLRASDREPRRRWEAARPNALWHADVCHGPALRIDGRAVPLRIHAILDDKSRFVVALEACTTERAVEMLRLMVKALRLHGAPDVLYPNQLSTIDMYELSEFIAEHFVKSIKVAHVAKRLSDLDLNKFGEDVVTNRGMVAKVFKRIASAEEWLADKTE